MKFQIQKFLVQGYKIKSKLEKEFISDDEVISTMLNYFNDKNKNKRKYFFIDIGKLNHTRSKNIYINVILTKY